MALLSDLPNEITLMILGLLLYSPADFESFVSTCKKIYSVAGADLDIHRALTREHRVYRFNDPCIFGPRGLPSHLLARIFHEPLRAFYVREIWIDREPLGWTGESKFERRQENPRVPDGEQITARVREVLPELVHGDEFWKRNRWPELKDEASVIPLLLLLLPNLSTLKVKCLSVIDTGWFYGMLKVITTMKGPGTPLSYLRHAQMPDMRLLSYMVALPSMTSLHGLAINLPEAEHEPDDLISETSNLKHLGFTRCSIHPKRLFGILTAFRELRSFTYVSKDAYEHSHHESQAHRTVIFDPSWVCAGLSAFTSSTLESLTLISRNNVGNFMGDIRGLRQLRNLHTESQLLLGEDYQNRKGISLAEVLPPNLETLKLECSRFEEVRIARHISILAEQKKDYVPALRKVEVFIRKGVQGFNASKNGPPGTRHHAVFPTLEEDYTHEAIVEACKLQGFELLVTAFDLDVIRFYEL